MKNIIFILLSILMFACVTQSQEDDGIIFEDDFESGTLSKWDQTAKRIAITDDPNHVLHGKYSAVAIAKEGEGAGGKLIQWFLPGYDTVYARWYCKFAEDFDQSNHMHFCHLLANRWDNKWSASGKAGIRPSGDDFFTTGLEPWRDYGRNPAPGEMGFYTYHMDMPEDRNSGKYWGEMFKSNPKFILKRNQWYCMEMMLKANTPGHADGEQAFWIDGKEIGRYSNLRFRTDEQLKINAFWLELYVHNSPKENKVWFDDAAISREYIGPKASSDQ